MRMASYTPQMVKFEIHGAGYRHAASVGPSRRNPPAAFKVFVDLAREISRAAKRG